MICSIWYGTETHFELSISDQQKVYERYLIEEGDVFDSTKFAYLTIEFKDTNDYQYDLSLGWNNHFVNSVMKS